MCVCLYACIGVFVCPRVIFVCNNARVDEMM